MDALQLLAKFQKDRKLHEKSFDKTVCTMNIMEELLELWGVNDCRDSRILADRLTEALKLVVSNAMIGGYAQEGVDTFEPNELTNVDALCDIQVFAGGDVMKIGYHNAQCLSEVGQEINSRTGKIVDGKFKKFITEDAKALWYEADFSGCKL